MILVTMSTRTLTWQLCGDIFVLAQSATSPTDQDFNNALEGYRTHLGSFRAILVSSKGGRMNALQRKQTTDFWETYGHVGKPPQTVVMSSSLSDRTILTALNWFLPKDMKIIPFGFDDFDEVFSFLNIDGAGLREQIRQTAENLHASM